MSRRISGRTRRGRLRLFDAWYCASLSEPPRRVVDVGFGEEPWTTFELDDRIARKWPDAKLEVIGLDVQVERAVAAARARSRPIRFEAVDGFDLPVVNADMVRAFNVLRGYSAEDVPRAWRDWTRALAGSGKLYDGSTDHDGHVMVAAEIDANARLVALLFATDFERGFAPPLFRDWLPRSWRRGDDEEHWVWRWMEDWTARAASARKESSDLRRVFADSLPEGWCFDLSEMVEGSLVRVCGPEEDISRVVRK